jgi:hypothetical protein
LVVDQIAASIKAAKGTHGAAKLQQMGEDEPTKIDGGIVDHL